VAKQGTGGARVVLPATVEELTGRLAGLDRLVVSSEWEKAAIVWAFTTNDNGRPQKASGSAGFPKPIMAFARLGLAGLRSDATIRTYRAAWQSAIDSGAAVAVAPGDAVVLPALTWPPTGTTNSNSPAGIARDPKALAGVLDRATAEVLAEALVSERLSEGQFSVLAEAVEVAATAPVTDEVLTDHVATPDAAVEARERKAREAAVAADRKAARAEAEARRLAAELARRDKAERDAQAIAAGGRVTTVEEVNRRNGGNLTDGVSARMSLLAEVESAIRKVGRTVEAMAPLSEEEAAHINRYIAEKVFSAMDAGVRS